MNWAAGTQCVAKGEHRKPKPGELAYHKGDILTIVNASTVPSRFKNSHKLFAQLIFVFVFSNLTQYFALF